MNGDQNPLKSIQNLSEQLDIQFALQATGLGIWELNPSTKQVLWDDRCRALFGLATDNALAYEQAIRFIHAQDRDRVDQAVNKALDPSSDGVYDQTYRTIGADDGILRWVRFYGRAYYSENGDLSRFAGVAQEVTQQVMSQQQATAIRQQAERQKRIYEAIASSTPDLMYVFDLNYRFIYANQALLAMWGKSWEQAIGNTLLENGYEPWHAQMHEREIDQVVATKQSIRGEVAFPHATLGKRIYDYVFAPVLNAKGKVEAVAGTTRDITELKQAEETVRESETNYRLLFESMQDGYTVCEAIRNEQGQLINYRFLQVNPAFSRLMGLDTTPVGRTAWELLPGLDSQWFGICQQVIDTRQPIRMEEYSEPLDKWYARTAFWFAEEQFAVFVEDITERKRQELNLTFLADVSQELVGLTNIDETIAALGSKIGQHFGLSRCLFVEIDEAQQVCWVAHGWSQEGAVDIPGKHRIDHFIGPQFQQASRAGEMVVINDVFADERTEGEQYAAFGIGAMVTVPLLRGDEWYFLLGFYDTKPREWQPGELALMRELTLRIWPRVERARAEAALQRSEAEFRTLTEAAPALVWVCSPAGENVYFNQRWYDYTGQTAQAASGLGWTTTMHPDDATHIMPYWQQCQLTGEPYEGEVRYRRYDGVYRWHTFRGLPRRNAQGQIEAWYGLSIDTHDEKQAQQTLEQADQRKDEFLAMLAHELRNPMAILHTTLGLLHPALGEPERPPLEEALTLMSREVTHLNRLVDDLLDVSRISQGKIELQTQPVDLAQLLQDSLLASRSEFRAHRQELTLSLSEQPLWVLGDTTRLAQIMRNLLTNAHKYTPDGGQIQVSLAGQGGLVVLSVKDTGIGLAADQLEIIFETFVQVSTTLDRAQGGLGLGLAMVKQLVTLHGGQVTVHSPGLGQGCEFKVTLTRIDPPAASSGPIKVGSPIRLTQTRVLLVDDNADLARVTALALRGHQYEVTTCLSGEEALRLVETWPPEVVLLDLGMPGLDGYTSCRRLRQLPWGQQGLIIALSGYGSAADRQKTREAGFDGHLLKPLKIEILIQLLESLFQPDVASLISSGEPTQEPSSQWIHDLRSALSIIGLASQELANTLEEPDRQEMLAMLERNVAQAQRLVSELSR